MHHVMSMRREMSEVVYMRHVRSMRPEMCEVVYMHHVMYISLFIQNSSYCKFHVNEKDENTRNSSGCKYPSLCAGQRLSRHSNSHLRHNHRLRR